MTLQTALRFVAVIRETPDLADLIRDLGPAATLDQLVSLGKTRGMEFTADELREAHKIDWVMRAARYRSEDLPG